MESRHFVIVFFILLLLAELQRAKRASEAPWVRETGNPSSRENLVMTSPYERPSVCPSVRPDYGGGEGSLAVTLTGDQKDEVEDEVELKQKEKNNN